MYALFSEYDRSDKIWTWSVNKYGNYDVFLFFKMTAAVTLHLG
jgi:hypothetical protein